MKGRPVRWFVAASVVVASVIVWVDDSHAAIVALGVAFQIIGFTFLAAVLVGSIWSMIQREES